MNVKTVEFSEFEKSFLSSDYVANKEFVGFDCDYLVIHCLLKQLNPSRVFEIGTSIGSGSRIIKNALPSCKLYTLDIQDCSSKVPKEVTFILGDSMKFDYSKYFPIDCWFIDGNHTYENVHHETKEALNSDPSLIIYHDADIPEVLKGIKDSLTMNGNNLYELFIVVNPPYLYSSSNTKITRVAFAIRNQ